MNKCLMFSLAMMIHSFAAFAMMQQTTVCHGFTLEQKNVIGQNGASCGYHALKNVAYLLRSEYDNLMSTEEADELLGPDGRWKQWVVQTRQLSAIKQTVKERAKEHFCIEKMFSSMPSLHKKVVEEELSSALCAMVEKQFEDYSKSPALPNDIRITVDAVKEAIKSLTWNKDTTSVYKDARQWLKSQTLDDKFQALSFSVVPKAETGDGFSGGEIEDLIKREEKLENSLFKDLHITVEPLIAQLSGIKEHFAQSPSYSHGFVLNTGGHWISLVVMPNKKAFVADSMHGNYLSNQSVEVVLNALDVSSFTSRGYRVLSCLKSWFVTKKSQEAPILKKFSPEVPKTTRFQSIVRFFYWFKRKIFG